MPPSRPDRLCLRCRALIDAEQVCDCADAGSTVSLGPLAYREIDEKLKVRPKIDREDLALRIVVSTLIGPGSVAVLLVLGSAVLSAMVEGFDAIWPAAIGGAMALLTAGWIGFLVWSTVEQHRTYYLTRPRPALPAGAAVFRGRLAGREPILAAEVRSGNEVGQIVLRDALATEPIVIERPGQRLELPAGRLRIEAPEQRWRTGRAYLGLTSTWRELPPELPYSGVLHQLELRPGTEVELLGGELDSVGREESSFRQAAVESVRWRGARPCLRVVG